MHFLRVIPVRGWNLNNYFILIFIERLYKKKSVCGFWGLNRVPLVCGLVTCTTRLSQIYIYSISLLSKVHLGFWLIILWCHRKNSILGNSCLAHFHCPRERQREKSRNLTFTVCPCLGSVNIYVYQEIKNLNTIFRVLHLASPVGFHSVSLRTISRRKTAKIQVDSAHCE